MDFIREIIAFEQWLRTNSLPALSQLLWYKLFMLCNGAGWPEWFVVENLDLMAMIKLNNEKSFIGYRDKLIENGLVEFVRGKKGSPNKYKIISLANCTYKLTAKTTVETTPKTTVQTTAKPTALYKHKQNENNIIINRNRMKCPDGEAGFPQSGKFRDTPAQEELTDETRVKERKDERLNKFDVHSEDLVVIRKYYERHAANLLSPTALMEIVDFLDAGVESALVCKAIDRSIDKGERNWQYAKGMINNCITSGILTLKQHEINEANRAASRARLAKNGGAINGGTNQRYNPNDRNGVSGFNPQGMAGFKSALDRYDSDGNEIRASDTEPVDGYEQ